MQLPGLIGFISVLILACNSKVAAEEWKINVERMVTAQVGSTVIIQCNFSYPQKYHTNNVKVMWKISTEFDQSNCSKMDNDRKAFAFHPDNVCVLEEYRGRTKLIGDKDKGSCSLQITRITHSERAIYVRIYAKNENYSFIKDRVSFSINGKGVKPDNSRTDINSYTTPDLLTAKTTITNGNGNDTSLGKILSVAIPVALLVVFILVAGIFIIIKYKRPHSVTREDSGYYANFSRALSNPPKREATCDTQAKKLPDDPVYINVKAPTGHMAPHVSCPDNVYANVNYRT